MSAEVAVEDAACASPAPVDSGTPKSPMKRSVSLPKWVKLGVSPPLWKQQYDNIVKMRESRDAPVDTVGCSVRDLPSCLPFPVTLACCGRMGFAETGRCLAIPCSVSISRAGVADAVQSDESTAYVACSFTNARRW